MPSTIAPLAALGVLCTALAAPACADSITMSASSASSAGSASLGSLSDSIHDSSQSSGRRDEVAEGDYRIVGVAEVAGRPGLLRLRLQAVAPAAAAFALDVPHGTLQRQRLAAGDVIGARQRPYGLEFVRADTREAFFLVLADDWHRELAPRPVTL